MVSSKLQPYKLMVEVLVESKAKFLKFIPIKYFVEGEQYEISFRIENIGEEVFPGGEFIFRVDWPSGQSTWITDGEIPALSRNESHETDKATPYVLSDGYGLTYIDRYVVKGEKDKPHVAEFYSTKEDKTPTDMKKRSILGIKSKSWQEIYEFMALIVATASLAIIAIERIVPHLLEFM